MAVRTHIRDGATLGEVLAGMTRREVCERLDVMDVWERTLFDDLSSYGRKELDALVEGMYGEIGAPARAEFLKAFAGGFEAFRRWWDGYRRNGIRQADCRKMARKASRKMKF